MSKSKTKKDKVKRISQLTVINPTAAGIDVSDTEMMVAYQLVRNNWKYVYLGVLQGICTHLQNA